MIWDKKYRLLSHLNGKERLKRLNKEYGFMGTILSSKLLSNDKVKLKICLDEEEALSLRGCVRGVHIFSSDLCSVESRLIERGKGGVTKYFLIHPKLRGKVKKQIHDIKCQRIESKNKVMFIYVVNRYNGLF